MFPHRAKGSLDQAVFANVVLVQQADSEFVLDFVLTIVYPHQLAARVVVNPIGLARAIAELERRVSEYELHFGQIARPTGEDLAVTAGDDPEAEGEGSMDLSRDLVALDSRLVGVFADSMIASCGPREFCMDFLANFHPRPVVASRVFMIADRIPRLLATLRQALLEQAPDRPWESQPARGE